MPTFVAVIVAAHPRTAAVTAGFRGTLARCAAAAAFALAACAGGTGEEAGAPEEAPAPVEVRARSGEPFEVPHAAVARVDGSLRIAFRRLAEESRCPPDARCPAAGNAAVELAAETGAGEAATIVLNTGRPPGEAPVHGWRVRLEGVAPGPPRPGAPVDTSAYVATLVVDRIP